MILGLIGLAGGSLRVYVDGDDVMQKILFVIPRREFKIKNLEKVVMDEKGNLKVYKEGKKLFKIYWYCDNTSLFLQLISDKEIPVFYKKEGKLITEEEYLRQDAYLYFMRYGKRLEDEERK